MKEKPVVERFLQYVSVDTRSVESKPGEMTLSPSSSGQTKLIKMIISELTALDVFSFNTAQTRLLFSTRRFVDGSLLVRMKGTIPGPHLAFASHVDTHPNNPGRANPMFHTCAGKDIVLPKGGVVIPASYLVGLDGKSIITSDGSSLLGGDDKAGVAALVEVVIRLFTQKIDSVPVDFWFTVDEEIGVDGITSLPEEIVKEWDVLWTIDGDAVGTIDMETMAGGKIVVEFKGADAHPGDDGMNLRPAHYAAARFVEKLSFYPSPWNTSGDESFYYATSIEEGGPNLTRVSVYPRSFNPSEIAQMAKKVALTAFLAAKRFSVDCQVANSGLIYTNIAPAINKRPELMIPALRAHEKILGRKPNLQKVRIGTDGGTINLFYPDLPTPNHGTGGRHPHSRTEFVVLDELEVLPEIILGMIAEYSQPS